LKSANALIRHPLGTSPKVGHLLQQAGEGGAQSA
jgi:hypothetical protein